MLAQTIAKLPSLPIIDISPFLSPAADTVTKEKTARSLYTACHDVGFFYLTGHGIPAETQQAVLDAAREFFLNANEQEKAAIVRKEVGEGGDGARGWQRLGENVTMGMNVGFRLRYIIFSILRAVFKQELYVYPLDEIQPV